VRDVPPLPSVDRTCLCGCRLQGGARRYRYRRNQPLRNIFLLQNEETHEQVYRADNDGEDERGVPSESGVQSAANGRSLRYPASVSSFALSTISSIQHPASSIQHPASSIQHHSIQAVMCREEGLRFTYNGRTDGDARGGETNLPADILLGYVLAYQRESNCTVNISLRSLLITTAHRGRSCEARPRVGGRGTRGGGVHDGVSLRTGPNNRAGCALNEPRDDHHGIRLYEHEEDQAQFEG
jgi:hypothetical protein